MTEEVVNEIKDEDVDVLVSIGYGKGQIFFEHYFKAQDELTAAKTASILYLLHKNNNNLGQSHFEELVRLKDAQHITDAFFSLIVESYKIISNTENKVVVKASEVFTRNNLLGGNSGTIH